MDEIWDLVGSVPEGFSTYFLKSHLYFKVAMFVVLNMKDSYLS